MIPEHTRGHSGLFRRLDPRTSLIAAAAAAFCFSSVRNLAPAVACLALALALVVASGFPARPLLKRLAAVNIFTLFLWLTVPLTMPGEGIALGPLTWSGEGVRLATLITIKCNAILLSFLALVSGIGLSRIGCALERLRVPAKLVFLFLFTSRYIHVVGEEWHRLQIAAKLRGFVPGNSPHTYRTIGNMLGLTLVNAVDRSRKIYQAMLLRGFSGTFHTVMELNATPADTLFALFFFPLLAVLLLLDGRPEWLP